jgi:hypothetical protein
LLQQTAPQANDPADSFAALRLRQPVTRVGGGYETDVFFSDDLGLALKLKHDNDRPAAALDRARRLRQAADRFCAYLGPEHSLLSDYLVVPGSAGTGRVLAVQPFLANARPLDSLDRAALRPEARVALAAQLAAILERAFACYRETGTLPDLYGLGPHDAAQARRWDPRWLLRTGWQMLAGQPLLAAHNLLLAADGRVVLVDYDPVCHGCLLCRVVYAARALLLWRDRRHIAALARP